MRRPTDRSKCGAERVSFSGEGSISVPSPVKEIKFEKRGRAQEQSTLCAAHVTAIGYRPALRYTLPIINKQWMRMRLWMTFTDTPKNLCTRAGTVMQPDYVGKPEDLYLWCLLGETKTLFDALFLRMRHWYTHYRDQAVP